MFISRNRCLILEYCALLAWRCAARQDGILGIRWDGITGPRCRRSAAELRRDIAPAVANSLLLRRPRSTIKTPASSEMAAMPETKTPAPVSPLSSVVNPVVVTIGGKTSTVLFAGLAPGFSGLYQINGTVPAGGDYIGSRGSAKPTGDERQSTIWRRV